MAFSSDTASNIKVDNGSVVSEGKNTMVVGMAFPGLQDSLKTAQTQSREIVDKMGDDIEAADRQKALDRINDLDISSNT